MVYLGLGLEVDDEDMEALVEDHRNELANEELHWNQQEELSSSEVEMSKGSISTA